MVDTGELEEYLNDKSANDGDIVTILGEGELGDITDRQTGKTKKALNLPVEVNGRKITYTPGKTATEALRKAFGRDSKTWVQKKFKVTFVKMQVGKDLKNVIYPEPIATIYPDQQKITA